MFTFSESHRCSRPPPPDCDWRLPRIFEKASHPLATSRDVYIPPSVLTCFDSHNPLFVAWHSAVEDRRQSKRLRVRFDRSIAATFGFFIDSHDYPLFEQSVNSQLQKHCTYTTESFVPQHRARAIIRALDEQRTSEQRELLYNVDYPLALAALSWAATNIIPNSEYPNVGLNNRPGPSFAWRFLDLSIWKLPTQLKLNRDFCNSALTATVALMRQQERAINSHTDRLGLMYELPIIVTRRTKTRRAIFERANKSVVSHNGFDFPY